VRGAADGGIAQGPVRRIGASRWKARRRGLRLGASPAVLVLAVVVVVVSACGGGGRGGVSATSAGGTPRTTPRLVPTPGGTVTVALDDVPTTLNDHTVAGDTPVDRMVASALWAQVFRVTPGLVPQLDTNVVDSAEVVSLSPQTVVYKIDPRAVWSDGVPVSASDFAYAWQSQRGTGVDVDGTPDSVASTLGYRDISSLTGSDNGKTVTVVFHTPFADWESLFDDLLPAHVAERVGWNTGFDTDSPSVLVSAGPWRVVSWTPGVSLVLGRNPKWWASPAFLDRVVLEPGTPTSMAAGLGDGRLQVAYPSSFDPSFLAQVSSSAALRSSSTLGTRMVQLVFNTRRAPLNSATVRQGIAHEIDRAGLVSAIGQPENHSVWEDDNHLFSNVESGYDDNGTAYTTPDPNTAAHLLEQGGLTLDARDTWSLHGKAQAFTLVWASDDPWSAATGPIVAAQLVAAGFEVDAEPVPGAQLVGSVLPMGAFDLAVVPVDGGAYPSAMASVFSTSPAITDGGVKLDYSGFDDAKVDALFTQAMQDLAPPSAQALYNQIDQDLWTSMPTLPLFAEPTVLVWSAALTSVSDDPGGLGPLWAMRLWTLLAPARPARGAGSSSTRG
jgi:peptide/nickel transport system substrate-binding protein